jgi:CubicO group peptidase (beta-lactamase class C family)
MVCSLKTTRSPEWIGAGWSNARPDEEAAITVQHLLTMTSGLHPRRLTKVAAPGAEWDYNTDAYQKLRLVLEAATGLGIDELTREWIFDPIGMSTGARWSERPQAAPDAVGERPWGLLLTVCDMARFGLLAQRRGQWGTNPVVGAPWFDEALASIPQKVDYGYLWWLTGKGHLRRAGAPPDTFAALGAMDQKIYVIPSVDLVVARQGGAAKESSEAESEFDSALIRALVSARE